MKSAMIKFAFATGKFIIGYVAGELILKGIDKGLAKYKEYKIEKEKMEEMIEVGVL